jgi:glycine/D-amino acid oxidase-like deaminating enzyme
VDLAGLRHTRHGWWLEEARAAFGPAEPAPPLAGDTSADILVVGSGYLGMWTAWHAKELEPEADVLVVEADLCGHGPSGRNGGFVSTLWDDLPTLRERAGDSRAVDVCRASERAVRGIGAWCDANDVDAWYVSAPMLNVATSDAQVGDWNDLVDACRAVGAPEQAVPIDEAEVRRRCASPLFRGGGMLLPVAANVQPARLALGLRRRLLERGVRLHERTRIRRLGRDAVAQADGGRVRARTAVLAVNAAAAGFAGHRLSLAVASSHIVLTEPVPDMLEQLGWTGGEAVCDSRTMLHYLRTTRDGRIAFGWGGGRMGFGGHALDRLELDSRVARRVQGDLVRFFPQLRDRAVTDAWGGPIDVSPTHLPIFGSRGAVHHGYGFTGNGVGPSYLGGEILARLALDRRDELTNLAIVEPDRKLFPPEPLRWAGGSVIRQALIRRDAADDEGRPPDPLTALVASLPRRLGLHLPR